MTACMLRDSRCIRFISWRSVTMKSNSAAPDFVRMSRFTEAIAASLRAIKSATIAGSASSALAPPPGGVQAGPASGSDGMKSPRSRTVSSASRMSGSDLPRVSRRPERVAGDAKISVTSTNRRPAASAMGFGVVSCHTESPRGFIGSVIIC
jgi:hypothetical protein